MNSIHYSNNNNNIKNKLGTQILCNSVYGRQKKISTKHFYHYYKLPFSSGTLSVSVVVCASHTAGVLK